jgi:hypothetical protein
VDTLIRKTCLLAFGDRSAVRFVADSHAQFINEMPA